MKKRFNNKLYKKVKVVKDDNIQLRVLYKKVGQAPQVKIINDIENFKKLVVLDKLDIIPYKHAFIICNNQNYKMQMPINIFFSLYHIAGDLVVINIDKDKREFKSLMQDQLLYYSKDLIGREPNYTTKEKVQRNTFKNYVILDREIETDIANNVKVDEKNNIKSGYAKIILSTLVDIEMLLASLLKNLRNGDDEDE